MDLSTAILTLSENGDLQRIHDKWLTRTHCDSQTDTVIDANRLSIGSFAGLFLICGIACVIALIIFFLRILYQYSKYNTRVEKDNVELPVESSVKRPARINSIRDLLSFVDKKEAEIKSIIKRKSSDKDTSHTTGRSSEGESLSPA